MSGLTGFGKGLAKGVWSAGKSTVQGVGDLARGGWSLATDPAARAQARQAATEMARRARDYAGQVRGDPARALRDARDGANRMYSEFDRARQEAAQRGESGEFWGNAAGQVGFEVGSMLVPVGVLSKAAKLRKAAGAADEVSDAARAMSAGRRAKAIGAGGGMPDAPLCVQGCKSGKLAPVKPGPAPKASFASRATLATRDGDEAVAYAKSLQGHGVYTGVDDFRAIPLKKGDLIIQGDPGPGDFYTTMADLEASGGSRAKLFQSLQVEANAKYGYRPRVKVFEVTEDTVAAFGEVAANPRFGPGGASQLVVKGKAVLKEVDMIDLGM